MATYIELRNLAADAELLNRCDVAIVVEAHRLINQTTPAPATDEEIAFAQNALESPRRYAEQALRYVIAKNKASTSAQITGADDETLQSNVEEAVSALAKGLVPGA